MVKQKNLKGRPKEIEQSEIKAKRDPLKIKYSRLLVQ